MWTKGCWYRQNEGEMFYTIGLRSRRSCQISTRSGDELVVTRNLIGGTRGAAFRVSRLSHGHTDPQFAFGGPASYISLRRKRKSRRELSSFPLHGIRGKDSSIRKSAKFLSHVLSLSSVYTYTHIRNRLSFSRWSLHVTSWASKRLEGKRAACLFDARGDIFRLFDRLNWLISRIWFASLLISSYAWENWNGCASNVNLQERIVGVAVFVLSKLVYILPRFFHDYHVRCSALKKREKKNKA